MIRHGRHSQETNQESPHRHAIANNPPEPPDAEVFWRCCGESNRRRAEVVTVAALLFTDLAVPYIGKLNPGDVQDPLLRRIGYMASGSANLYGRADVQTIIRLLPAFQFPKSQIDVQVEILRSVATMLTPKRVKAAVLHLIANRPPKRKAAA